MSSATYPILNDQWKHLLLISKFGVNEVETKLKILNEEYQFLHDYNPIERINSRIKAPKEIMNKLRRMGLEPNSENAYQHLHDIGGIRVTCSFAKDVYTIASLLQQQTDLKVIEIKDYIQEPKPNGYRSLHVLVEVPVFMSDSIRPVVVEVQFRSVSMDLWASIEHKIYYKAAVNIPQELNQRLKHCADQLDALDQEMYEIKEEIKKYSSIKK